MRVGNGFGKFWKARVSACFCAVAITLSLVAQGDTDVPPAAEDGAHPPSTARKARAMKRPSLKPEEEWQHCLTPEQYYVLRERGTEPPFTGKFTYWKKPGIFKCAACGAPLFSTEHKFDSGTGWPSFWTPVSPDAIGTEEDRSYGMVRTEVHCARCGGHLGHVFPDGPPPTRMRYCINSVALEFEEKQTEPAQSSPPEGASSSKANESEKQTP